jgi:hypothetical protein
MTIMNTRTLRIAAATSLAGIGLALVAFGASAATCTSSHPGQWNEINFCGPGDGSIVGGMSGQGDGTGRNIAVELINGSKAVGYGLNAWGGIITGCTATDTTMDGTSVYDYNGCGQARGTWVRVTY